MCLKTLFEHMIKAKHITRIAYKQPPEKGDPGASGAIRRTSEWAGNVQYYSGAPGEEYQDIVLYNGAYYQCIKTHVSNANATPQMQVGSTGSNWGLMSGFKAIATKVIFVGDGISGWIIDNGRIYHSSGLIELNADGTIQTSNGKFSLDKNGNIVAMSGTFSGFLKIPFKSFADGASYLGNGVYRVSNNFNLYSDGYMVGYEIGLQLPAAASFSGTLLTIYDSPVKTKSSPVLTITCQSGASIYHPSKKGTYGLSPVSSIRCERGGLIQLLAVNLYGGGDYCSWVVVSDVMPDAIIT